MNEWKKLTAEQVAWLEEQPKMSNGSVHLIGAEFSTDRDNERREWLSYQPTSNRYHTPYWRPKSYRDLEVLKIAGFPMGDAESLNMRMASDIANVHAEQAKAQADAEWQRERRGVWASFVSACIASGRGNVEYIHVVDSCLAEFDKRFGGDK